jgi:hypothetical protein
LRSSPVVGRPEIPKQIFKWIAILNDFFGGNSPHSASPAPRLHHPVPTRDHFSGRHRASQRQRAQTSHQDWQTCFYARTSSLITVFINDCCRTSSAAGLIPPPLLTLHPLHQFHLHEFFISLKLIAEVSRSTEILPQLTA